MIRFDQVSKRFDTGHEALLQVNFHIPKGQMAFLTGKSGAGKSTLLKLMLRMDVPTAGQVFINNQNLNHLSREQIAALRRNIGVVFQNHQLLFDRSVFDNVALPLLVAGYDYRDVGRRVRAALDKVSLLHKERAMPETLSGGEQQRVGIARAVVNRPDILLADEPTGNLDPGLAAEIMELFNEFNRVGVTVLIASHDLSLIARLHHRVLTLRDGRLIGGAGLGIGGSGSARPRDDDS
jgi:cell division transport system ATP-binding protein